MENYFHLNMDRRAVNQISALGLAHCGDAVFELLVRSFLCASGKALNGNLHRATVDLVCAPAQAARAARMLPLLTEEALAFYKRTCIRCRKTPPMRSMPEPRGWNACLARYISPASSTG